MGVVAHSKLYAAGLLVVLALLVAVADRSGAADYAPILPLASHSLLLDVAAAGNRRVVAGERGHILYSDDNGSHWQQARVPTIQMLTALYFADDHYGWAVGHDGLILASDDGGASWRIQRDGLAVQQQANLENREQAHRRTMQLKQAMHRADDQTRRVLQTQLDDAAMDLEDTELALSEPVFTSPLMDVWFQDRNRGWAVGAFGSLLRTDDGGEHWVGQTDLLYNPDEFHLNAITGDRSGRLFIAGEGGLMYRSADGGNSWQSIEPFYAGSWFGVVYSAAHDALLAFGLQGSLFRSKDFGDTWVSVSGDNRTALAGGSVSSSGDIVLVGGVGTVLRSRDGGLSFSRDVMPDRLSLSSAMFSGGQLLLVGQGGALIFDGGGQHD